MNIQIGKNNTVWIFDPKYTIIREFVEWCSESLDVGEWYLLPQLPDKVYQRIKFSNDESLLLFLLRWT